MIHAAPVVLSREFGFARTMISTVRRSIWLPQHLHIENEGDDPQSRRLREYLTGAQIHLANAPVEAKLIRKRCGLLVLSPKQDKRTCKDVSGCSGYIAAPITIQDRAIGMLHADRPEPDGIVTMEHLDELEAFAECLAVAFEGAVLKEKAAQQHVAVGNLCAHVEELIGQSKEPAWWQLSAGASGRRHDAYSRGDVPCGGRGHQQRDRAVPGDLRRDREVASQTYCPQAQYVEQGSGGGRLRRHRNRACRSVTMNTGEMVASRQRPALRFWSGHRPVARGACELFIAATY
jgi:hypothetical protein